MQELILFSSIPQTRRQQILSVLAGLTATPTPRPILEYHHILRPAIDPPNIVQQTYGASQDIDPGKLAKRPKANADQYVFSDLIENVMLRRNDTTEPYGEPYGGEETRWLWQLADTPDAASRSVIARRKTMKRVRDDELSTFLRKNDLVLVNQFILEGDEFVYNNVVLRLQRCKQVLNSSALAELGSDLADLNTTLLDKSDAYILQASLCLEENPSPDLLGHGTEELRRLKDELDGCVELGMVNRLSLDTKVK